MLQVYVTLVSILTKTNSCNTLQVSAGKGCELRSVFDIDLGAVAIYGSWI